MRFKRRPNEIKPPPIFLFLSLSLVAKGAERLIRDFSSVISLPRRENDGTRLASCRPGQRLHVQYHPVAFGGLQDDGPLPVVLLRRFRGASESLSSWRQLETGTGWPWKNCPLPGEGYWCIPGWTVGKRVSFPAGWKNSRDLVAFSFIRLNVEYREKGHLFQGNWFLDSSMGSLLGWGWKTFGGLVKSKL